MERSRLVTGLVTITSFFVAACNSSGLVGAPAAAPPQTDTFTTSQSGGQSDILFVINNTDASMDYKAKVLGNSASGFISYLVQQEVDFHIGVTSMDMDTPFAGGAVGSMGALNGSPAVIDSTTPNLLQTFQTNLVVGSNGDHIELGIDAALAAVTAPMISGQNASFLRPAAKLYVVWISDEDDNATVPGDTTGTGNGGSYVPADYVTAFASAKGGSASSVVLSAIAGPALASPSTGQGGPGNNNAGCNGGTGSSTNPDSTGGDPQYDYSALISLSHGLFESICDADYTSFLTNLGFQVGAPQSVYLLTKTPSSPSSIVVKVNGTVVPSSDWTYSASANSVTFIPSAVPPSGATVSISYQVS